MSREATKSKTRLPDSWQGRQPGVTPPKESRAGQGLTHILHTGAQPANPPLFDFGHRAWLIANAQKTPCDGQGRLLKGWNGAGALRTYQQAKQQLGGPVQFIGLRMDAVPELAALDLDDVLNAAGGHVDPVAASIWAYWPSYTEITPSGRGLRIWWRVHPPAEPVTVQTRHEMTMNVYDYAAGCLKPATFHFGRELYYRAMRFLIVTEKPYRWYQGAPAELATITPADLMHIATLVRERRVHEEDLIEPDELEHVPAQAAPEPPSPPPAREHKQRAIGGVLRWIATQREGNRNNATYWAAHRLREAGVAHEHAQALLVPIATGLGLPEREAARTIASAYGGGQ